MVRLVDQTKYTLEIQAEVPTACEGGVHPLRLKVYMCDATIANTCPFIPTVRNVQTAALVAIELTGLTLLSYTAWIEKTVTRCDVMSRCQIHDACTHPNTMKPTCLSNSNMGLHLPQPSTFYNIRCVMVATALRHATLTSGMRRLKAASYKDLRHTSLDNCPHNRLSARYQTGW